MVFKGKALTPAFIIKVRMKNILPIPMNQSEFPMAPLYIIRSTDYGSLSNIVLPIDKYPAIPITISKMNKVKKLLLNTLRNLLGLGLEICSATEKKFVRQLKAKIAIPKDSKT